MARKIEVKLILQLHHEGISQNEIASTRHMSKTSVSDVLQKAKEMDIYYPQVSNRSDENVYRLFYPDKFQNTIIYEPADYDYVHNELKKTGVTLKLLWEEYSDSCRKEGKLPMGYRRFTEGYGSHVAQKDLTNHLEHKPGESCEVDWSGPTMSYCDQYTGEVITVYLFVATLPYSQYSYVEPTLDMKMDSWIRCHIHMYEYFGGVPTRTICDNLKTGVVAHPKEGEIILTQDYEAMGMYYVTAIMPAGVRKPKQKASAEGTVGKIATHIIAKLRNEHFTSFDQLKTAVREKLEDFNNAEFQKREGSRSQVHKEEIPYLKPLPDRSYEIASWDYGHKVGLNFHVIYKKNYYSVPYQYIKQQVDLRVLEHSVEIYSKGLRIATHQKLPDYYEYHYSTLEEHMPPQFLKQEWDDQRIREWADKIGRNTREVIDRIFSSFKIKEQGYNPSLSVLRLSKKYSQSRLENACELALKKFRTPRYRHINAILSSNQDILFTENKDKAEKGSRSGYLRGNEYYGGNNQ